MEKKERADGRSVGIGFATGRKSFQKVLRSYIHSWKESGLVDNDRIKLNLFVAYDLNYRKTTKKDFTGIDPELTKYIDDICFIGRKDIQRELEALIDSGVVDQREVERFAGTGYAAQRNAILYAAIKKKMDSLIFLDDDEYPVAVTNTRTTAVWGGQHVLSMHVKNIEHADITHGYHCGYVSPIPYIRYNTTLSEADFRTFIEAISNDILNWDTVRTVMQNGGVTYADTNVLVSEEPTEVREIHRAKFISGSNLGINLREPRGVYPFYNPPGARGEDTFLGTCLAEKKVLKVPCYTFHDGFSTYNHLLEGVLPIRLKFIEGSDAQVAERFLKACIGWVRYKPLLLYITQAEHYDEAVKEMRWKLQTVLPQICEYFDRPKFMDILKELNRYDRQVRKHHREFLATQQTWKKVMEYLYVARK